MVAMMVLSFMVVGLVVVFVVFHSGFVLFHIVFLSILPEGFGTPML